MAQEIIFRTTVENLRLRTAPNLESTIIKTVPKGETLYWLNERTKDKTFVDWKGEKVSDYWYQVKFVEGNNDSTAWVFGKGIEFGGLKFGNFENPLKVQNLENQWIKIEKATATDFQKQVEIAVDWKKINADTINDKSKFTLYFENGKKKTFIGYDTYVTYPYGVLKIGKNIYYKCYLDGCMGQYFWIRKKDGNDMQGYVFPTFYSKERNGLIIEQPIFASDKKTFIFESGCTFSDNNDCNGLQSTIFNIGRFKDDITEVVASFEELNVIDFRFITNQSGIAKLKDDTYWKITLK